MLKISDSVKRLCKSFFIGKRFAKPFYRSAFYVKAQKLYTSRRYNQRFSKTTLQVVFYRHFASRFFLSANGLQNRFTEAHFMPMGSITLEIRTLLI